MIEKLSVAKTVKTHDGLPVRVTHRAWGRTHQLWNDPPLTSYSVLGVMDPEKGFRPVAGTEELVQFGKEDYDKLIAANRKGKKLGVFRTDDVIAAHKEIVAREKSKAVATQPALTAPKGRKANG
jgi:hypothetical protein